MAPISKLQGKELETLKQWPSQPRQTNYEMIPGLAAVKYEAAIFIQKLVLKFCSDASIPNFYGEWYDHDPGRLQFIWSDEDVWRCAESEPSEQRCSTDGLEHTTTDNRIEVVFGFDAPSPKDDAVVVSLSPKGSLQDSRGPNISHRV